MVVAALTRSSLISVKLLRNKCLLLYVPSTVRMFNFSSLRFLKVGGSNTTVKNTVTGSAPLFLKSAFNRFVKRCFEIFHPRYRFHQHIIRASRYRMKHLSVLSTQPEKEVVDEPSPYVKPAPLNSTENQPINQYVDLDPFKLAEPDLIHLYSDIKKELGTKSDVLQKISSYHFDGKGKAFRPLMIVLMARALNFHILESNKLLDTQHRMAIIAEMIHTASLVHDDVIDTSDTRRGKSSVNERYGHKKAILAGDFILAQAARVLAQLGNEDVVHLLAQVLLDLVQGEFMQMSSTQEESERFSNYLEKTFKKTASLTAYTCKAAAVLAGANHTLQEAAFQYGRNVGIAFQIIDDLLDFSSNQSAMGKPTTADLKLGLATAPVLFASQKYPELKPLILRRFSQVGDVEKACEAVRNSDGLNETKKLARRHCNEALRHISILNESEEKKALIYIIENVLERSK